jgi:hypothetical protein
MVAFIWLGWIPVFSAVSHLARTGALNLAGLSRGLYCSVEQNPVYI